MQIPNLPNFHNEIIKAGYFFAGTCTLWLVVMIDLYLFGIYRPEPAYMALAPAIPAVLGVGLIFVGLVYEEL